MKRRTFLVAATGAAAATGLLDLGRSPDRAFGAPLEVAQPTVATRTDLVAVADTVSGITLDGTVSDPRWGDPHFRQLSTLYAFEEVPDTAVHVVHDATTVYVGVRVGGAAAATVSHVSLLFRGAVGTAHQVVTVELRKATPPPVFEWGGSAEALTGHRSASHLGEDEATCAVAVPLSTLGVTGDALGQQIGMNVVLDHEDMTAPTATAVPTRTSVNSYQGSATAPVSTDIVAEDRVAAVHLGQVAPLASGRGVPELIMDVPVELDYLDFTHKQIRLGLDDTALADAWELDWRAPGGDWTRLTAAAKPYRGGLGTSIEHPAPTAYGHYQLRIGIVARDRRDRVLLATFDREDLIMAGDALPANLPQPPRGTTKINSAPASPAVSALLALVPDRTGFTFCGVPDSPGLHPNATYTWSPDMPDKIVAKSTGTAYPNDEFPEDQELTVVNQLGATVSYPYHQDADGKRYFLSGHLWYQQREYVYAQLPALAAQDPLGAARVLHRFTQVFPGWVPTNEYPWFNRPVNPTATPRNFYWGGLWTRWSISSLGPMLQIGQALATIEQTDALDVLSEEIGQDVRATLVDDTLRPTIDQFRTFTRRYTNNDYPSYLGMGTLAEALGDSSLVHESVEWAREYLRRGFLHDGFWKETTLSYHLQSINGLFRVADALAGWSDAADYASPRSGNRFDDLDLLGDMPVLAASRRIPQVLVYPDGKLLPMADTWANETAAEPDHGVGSVVFGGGGVARLSRGGASPETPPSADVAAQAYLLFTPKYGHNQLDPLSLALYAEGQELLPDLGYSHTKYRRWTCSTLGHNTVLVDSDDMDVTAGADGGSLEVFDTFDPAVQVVRAGFGRAYPQTSRYVRETWWIEASDTGGYALDLFRVAGGSQHEWALNGDANRDAEMTTTAELSTYGPYLLPEGVAVTEPETELEYGDAEGNYYGYIYVRDVQRAALVDGTFDVTLTTTVEDGPGSGARVLGVSGEDTEMFLGRSPSVRATRLNGVSSDTNVEAEKYDMPKLVLRRQGDDLRSSFVTAIEPLAAGATPTLASVEVLAHDGSEDDLAVRVTHVDGTSDVILSCFTGDGSLTAEGVTLAGRLGFARITDGAATRLHMVGGTSLVAPTRELTGTGPATGTLTATRRTFAGDDVDALVTSAAVPDWVVGLTIVVTHPDGKTHPYPIKAVSTSGGTSLIELDRVDPGFVIDADGTSTMEFSPFTRWTGETTFRVENSASG